MRSLLTDIGLLISVLYLRGGIGEWRASSSFRLVCRPPAPTLGIFAGFFSSIEIITV
jgi:hypothetical protein